MVTVHEVRIHRAVLVADVSRLRIECPRHGCQPVVRVADYVKCIECATAVELFTDTKERRR